MRPTREIIELSKKLHELGYEPDWKVDYIDSRWCIIDYFKKGDESIDLLQEPSIQNGSLCAYGWDRCGDWEPEEHQYSKGEYVPIPSLEDGFSFLKEHGFIDFTITDMMGGFEITSETDDGIYYSTGDSIHESTLSFMVEILEEKQESK